MRKPYDQNKEYIRCLSPRVYRKTRMGEIIAAQLDRQWAGKLSLHGVMLSTFNSPCLPNVDVITAFKLLHIISMQFKTVIVLTSAGSRANTFPQLEMETELATTPLAYQSFFTMFVF